MQDGLDVTMLATFLCVSLISWHRLKKYAIIMGINNNPAKAITSYNLGPGGAQEVDPSAHGYTVKVKQHADKLKNVSAKSGEI